MSATDHCPLPVLKTASHRADDLPTNARRFHRRLLAVAIANGASDLHLREGTPPTLRVDGELRTFAGRSLTALSELYLQALIPIGMKYQLKEETPQPPLLRTDCRRAAGSGSTPIGNGRVSLAIRVLRPPLVTLRSVFPGAECDRRRSQGTPFSSRDRPAAASRPHSPHLSITSMRPRPQHHHRRGSPSRCSTATSCRW